MKVRIEGCTAEQLNEYSSYLSLEKVYEAKKKLNGNYTLDDDTGEELSVRINPETAVYFGCAHLPQGAKWVEVL